MVGEGGLGVAVDAAESNLTGRGFNGGHAIALGALGGLDVELGTVEEELVALELGAVGIAPGATTDVVNVAGIADGEDEGGCLDVVKLLYVAGKGVDHGVGDASEDDALDISILDSPGDLLL